MDYIEDLHELCETISHEIADANEKIRAAGGKLSGADVDYVDKLTHTLKSVKGVIAMAEDEDGYSRYYPMTYSRRNDNSYARRRDSMGRYSRRYSRANDVIEQLEDIMETAPDDRSRKEIKKLIEKMQNE